MKSNYFLLFSELNRKFAILLSDRNEIGVKYILYKKSFNYEIHKIETFQILRSYGFEKWAS